MFFLPAYIAVIAAAAHGEVRIVPRGTLDDTNEDSGSDVGIWSVATGPDGGGAQLQSARGSGQRQAGPEAGLQHPGRRKA
eukprot:scaffold193688_cov16-Prasinocladus_malaysianus.AAC.1